MGSRSFRGIAAAAAPDHPPSPATVTIVGARTYTFATIGRTVTLSATASAGATVAWVSTDSGVATVATAGVVTAKGNGLAMPIAQAGAGRDTVQVAVSQSPARVAPADPSPVAAGIRAAILVLVTDSGGTVVPGFSGDIHLALTRPVAAIGQGTLEAELRTMAIEGPSAARRGEIAREAVARHADLERFRARLRPGDPLAKLASMIPARGQAEVVRRAVADAVFSYRARARRVLGLEPGRPPGR